MSDLRRVWIYSIKEKLEIILPITPTNIKFRESMATTSQDLFGFGEIGTGSSAKLDTWSCESFFPHQDNDYVFNVSPIKYNAGYYVEVFKRWMKEEQVLQFQYYSETEKINDYYCKITGFSHGEENGNKNIYYTLDFQEHKTMNVIGQYIVTNNDAIIASYGSDTYYVGEGDNLITIAQKIFGDSTKWAYLMTLNSLNNPLDIKVGQALKI
jgi:hypothetical protein